MVVVAPRIQGYPRAHCLLHTAYHGFVWQLVWILSLQPKLVSDLKTCPTSVLRFDMNVKSVPIKRWLLPGGAGMSLGSHAATGHRICVQHLSNHGLSIPNPIGSSKYITGPKTIYTERVDLDVLKPSKLDCRGRVIGT